MREEIARPDAIVARIAARQHGVVAVGQIHAAGIGRSAISLRVRAGRLHRVHRGVYAVGHTALSREGTGMAAILAAGDGELGGGTILAHWGAVLSHRSAASLWALLPWDDSPVDVTVPGGAGRARRAGIRIHRSATLRSEMSTLHRGVPVTTPQRTISDLRRTLPAAVVRRALRQAEVLGLPVADHDDHERTRSELELTFLRICRRHLLPEPEVNVRIGPHEVDFCWRRMRVVVETDSYRFHRGEAGFHNDHARDLALRERGFDVLRFDERQVAQEPVRIARQVRQAIGAAP
jgi:very-short-patch-repair endonuclease